MANQQTRRSVRKQHSKKESHGAIQKTSPPSDATKPDDYAARLMAELEADFMAAPERRQTREGYKIKPGVDYSDWYIKPVEDGPWPYKTREEFRQSLDRWEKGIDNEDLVRKQLVRHGVVTLNGEPYDRQGEVIPIVTSTYTRMMKLIDDYRYEEEPDQEADDDLSKMLPEYKPLPNRFTELMQQREKILERMPLKARNEDDEPVGDATESRTATEVAGHETQFVVGASKPVGKIRCSSEHSDYTG